MGKQDINQNDGNLYKNGQKKKHQKVFSPVLKRSRGFEWYFCDDFRPISDDFQNSNFPALPNSVV